MRASPVNRYDDLKAELGIFAQDRWTMNRLTLNAGLRFDYFNTYFPEQQLGPGPLVPNRNFTVARVRLVQLEGPVAARRGGRTTCSATARRRSRPTSGRYVLAGDRHGRQRRFRSWPTRVTRSWNDDGGLGINGDFVPDCDLLNPLANGECGAMSDLRFGSRSPARHTTPTSLDGLGQAPLQLGVLGRRAARADCRAWRSTSATSAAGTATSP